MHCFTPPQDTVKKYAVSLTAQQYEKPTGVLLVTSSWQLYIFLFFSLFASSFSPTHIIGNRKIKVPEILTREHRKGKHCQPRSLKRARAKMCCHTLCSALKHDRFVFEKKVNKCHCCRSQSGGLDLCGRFLIFTTNSEPLLLLLWCLVRMFGRDGRDAFSVSGSAFMSMAEGASLCVSESNEMRHTTAGSAMKEKACKIYAKKATHYLLYFSSTFHE